MNLSSMTSMERLYAVGETSCNGVHGANRLASNSLLESMVFADRCAKEITEKKLPEPTDIAGMADLSAYEDLEKLKADYKQLVLDEIEKEKQRHE